MRAQFHCAELAVTADTLLISLAVIIISSSVGSVVVLRSGLKVNKLFSPLYLHVCLMRRIKLHLTNYRLVLASPCILANVVVCDLK